MDKKDYALITLIAAVFATGAVIALLRPIQRIEKNVEELKSKVKSKA